MNWLDGQLAAALDEAMGYADPSSLASAERLRRRFPADVAAAALTQVELRSRARHKFGDASSEMFFTRAGLEQASRPEVAAWRAGRLAAAGVSRIIDMGCGIGADSRAFAQAGIHVQAIELDPDTCDVARANLAGLDADVRCANVTEIAWRGLGEDVAIFCDPARRTAKGRTWRVNDFTPEWSFVADVLTGHRPCCVKMGPGLATSIILPGVESTWISEHGDVVEAGLWNVGDQATRAAVVLPGDHRLVSSGADLPTGPVGRYLIEPDGAVAAAGALADIAPGLWRLADKVAYLGSDEPLRSPFAACFEIVEILPASLKPMRSWVREHDVGILEIKKRSFDADPAQLRRRLKPRGCNHATIVLAHTTEGAKALVVERCGY